MRIINLKDTVSRPGEYVVGAEQTRSHVCYLLYGVLKAHETRVLSPGHGHEEIFCCMEGAVEVRTGEEEVTVQKGQCFHLKGEESAEISNQGEGVVVYVLAGGHSDQSHHGEGTHHSGHSHQH